MKHSKEVAKKARYFFLSVYFHVFSWWSCIQMQTLFIIKGGRKFIDGPDTGYSISCQNKNKFLGFCKLSIIELKLLTGISLNTVMMIMMTMLIVMWFLVFDDPHLFLSSFKIVFWFLSLFPPPIHLALHPHDICTAYCLLSHFLSYQLL